MNIINFKSDSCRSCFKCVRSCEVKAITVKNQKAEIIDDLCVLCGTCLNVCPQEAKFYLSDLAKVRQWISMGKKVVVSLAPSFAGAFPGSTPGQIISALRQLGFTTIRETAEAASVVTKEYGRLMNEDNHNIITSSCPTVVKLIETYYPELIPSLAPIASPMIIHGRFIKSLYGKDTKVVFIGPCISKKEEANISRNFPAIDAVLLYGEIERMFNQKEINRTEIEETLSDNPSPNIDKLYPVSGGILQAMETNNVFNPRYRKLGVSGIKNCLQVCNEMKEGTFHHCFIEMSACGGSCVNGSASLENKSSFKARIRIEDYSELIPSIKEHVQNITNQISTLQQFSNCSRPTPLPSEEQIQEILIKTGKKDPSKILNCGACGYSSCREKAIAVFQGKADIKMCIPYLHEKAESLSNLVMETTPNLVMIIDENLQIQEFSHSCERTFHKTKEEAQGMDLIELIDDTDYEWVISNQQHFRGKKIELKEYGKIFLQDLTYIPNQNSVLAILIDITKQEDQAQKAYKHKIETTEIAEKVIQKQMMVAQMIAGLLGETTAETKITLNKLCKTMLDDDEGGDF